MVLELGNLWYNRYLVLDGQGVSFLADEALAAALRYYRESRELCVDLVADSGEEGGDHGARGSFARREASAAAADASARGGLLRAEYNVGMTLFEQDEPADAARHLSAAVSIFRDMFAGAGGGHAEHEAQQARGFGGEGVEEGGGATAAARKHGVELEARAMAAWKAAGHEQEELAGLGGVYASSLFLLAECLLSSPEAPPSSASAASVLPGKEGLPRVLETLEASAGAFLGIDDPSRALDPLLKLVETLLRSAGDAGGDEGRSLLSRAATLCEQAASGLGRRLTEHGPGENDNDVDDETLQLGQIREGIDSLRALWRVGGSSSDGEPCNAGTGGRDGGRQEVASPSEQRRRGSGGVEDATAPSGPADVTPVRRVGPAPTSGFAERRRRLRAAAAATGGGGGGAARNATSRKQSVPNRSRHTTTTAEGLPAATAATCEGGVGVPRDEWLARDAVGSFAGLRAAVAAGEGAAEETVAAGAEGRAAGENGKGRKAVLFNSYREKVRKILARRFL